LFYGGGWSQLGIQAIGVLVFFVWAFGTGLILFYILKKAKILRVS
jgi:Amt family ammonium transporter